jgi:hypothetical protein
MIRRPKVDGGPKATSLSGQRCRWPAVGSLVGSWTHSWPFRSGAATLPSVRCSVNSVSFLFKQQPMATAGAVRRCAGTGLLGGACTAHAAGPRARYKMGQPVGEQGVHGIENPPHPFNLSSLTSAFTVAVVTSSAPLASPPLTNGRYLHGSSS